MKITFSPVALAVCVSFHAAAQTLLSYNLADASAIGESPAAPYTFASSFVVGQQNVNVTSIDFILGSYNSPSSQFQCSAYIYLDSRGQPGLPVGSDTLTLNNVTYPPQYYDFEFGSTLTLYAGLTYWAAIGITYPYSGPLYVGAANDLSGFSDNGITPTLNFADSSTYPPSSPFPFTVNYNYQTLEYTLDGSPVPEPGSAMLAIAGFAALMFRRMIFRNGTA